MALMDLFAKAVRKATGREEASPEEKAAAEQRAADARARNQKAKDGEDELVPSPNRRVRKEKMAPLNDQEGHMVGKPGKGY